jgi:hypothetical protein
MISRVNFSKHAFFNSLLMALERTAAPLCRFGRRGFHKVAGFGGRRGRAAVAQLDRSATAKVPTSNQPENCI